MLPKLVLVGAGGHAKVAVETLLDAGRYEIVGALDQDECRATPLGIPIIGNDDRLGGLRNEGIEFVFPALGDNTARVNLGHLALSKGLKLATAISPHAYISRSSTIGSGVLIVAGAVINADARVDDLAIVNTNASVDHDCNIGEGAHVAPGAALAGQVTIGRRAFIGIGASIIPKITIGDAAIVGAGACVVSHVPPDTLVYGVPARPERLSD